MVNQEIFEDYSNSVRRLKRQSMEAGLTDEEFKELYFEALQSVQNSTNVQSTRTNNWSKRFAFSLTIIVITITVLVNYKTLYSCTACSLQEYIYPGLRLLRKLSIPIISLFPSLTALYHETCLIQNPFFTVVDMDCWPCSTVNSVREVFDPKPMSDQHKPPFLYKTDQDLISIDILKSFYLRNIKHFDNEFPNIQTGTKAYIDPKEMFLQHSTGEKQIYVWKFNNMNVAKVLRQVIPRPVIVPKFGQSTERFIIVDTSQELFKMPDTECSFSFLLSLSGSREIHLVPAEECRHQCKTLKVDLQETYLLWYNWWYWRPVVQPSNGNSTFIAHIGSYC